MGFLGLGVRLPVSLAKTVPLATSSPERRRVLHHGARLSRLCFGAELDDADERITGQERDSWEW